VYFSLFGILRDIFKSFSSFLKENSISCKKKPECNKLRSSSVPMNDNSFTARNFMSSTIGDRGPTRSSFRGGAIFIQFHSMTSSWWFNRGTTFSQTVTDNNNVFLPADTKNTHTLCTIQTHTLCTMLVNKNRLNRALFFNLRNFWLHAICACTERHSINQIRWEKWWLGLRIWCLVKRVGLGFMLQLEKEK